MLFGSATFLLPASVTSFSHSGVSRVFVGTPKKSNTRKVKDCMTPNPVTLKTTDTVDEAIHILLSNSFNGAPVIDPGERNKGHAMTYARFALQDYTTYEL